MTIYAYKYMQLDTTISEELMKGRFFSTFARITYKGSEFGNFFSGDQKRCLKSGRSVDCEGNPTRDEARRDYIGMMRPKNSIY